MAVLSFPILKCGACRVFRGQQHLHEALLARMEAPEPLGALAERGDGADKSAYVYEPVGNHRQALRVFARRGARSRQRELAVTTACSGFRLSG